MNKFWHSNFGHQWHRLIQARTIGHTLIISSQRFISTTKKRINPQPLLKVGEEKAECREIARGDEDIVISGLSGRFPMSENLEEFTQNLYDGVDMITEQTRWDIKYGIPAHLGTIQNMDKFDAEFFGINRKFANVMDPHQRKLMEVTFEAIVDAGINPESFRGTKTGVYVAGIGGEITDYWTLKANIEIAGAYAAVCFPNFMLPGSLSYAFDLKGPSMHLSTGCSASLVALEAAVRDIRTGNSDAAIICSANFHFSPGWTQTFNGVGALSPDGRCRSFDSQANGYVRSEAAISLLIQKKKHAKRNYATIRHVKSNCDGFKADGLVFPSKESQEQLLRDIYADAGIDPGQVVYVEAHGTGTSAGDPQELGAIYNVISNVPSRTQPLLIGSVKSNMGHAENTAGLAGITKVILSLQKGIIPANLHFKRPNEACKDLFGENLKVVTETTSIEGGLMGVSSFGMGGSNAHVILEAPYRTLLSNIESDSAKLSLPLLLPYSGRSSSAVEESLKNVCAHAVENEAFRGLVQGVYSKKVSGHTHRGFAIVEAGLEETPKIQAEVLQDDDNRPLWFVFPGMGSQWNEMGKDLMKVDAFRESMGISRATLLNAGMDLESLVARGNSSIFHNIRSSMVSITAIQIALYDTLTSLGLKPEGFLGHSSGEILCAYADGCFSGEEALLVADARGRALLETTKIPGGMASVGLTWSEIQRRCPPSIHPACHNAKNNVSVSGPLESIQNFVKQLGQEGIFAQQVNTCNCAPHSPFVLPAGDVLQKSLDEIISGDRPRSNRWVSSCVPKGDWGSPLAQNSSPAYHVHNMVNPVLFYEALQHVPSNAVVVEIAPRGLLQGIIKESTQKDCSHIAPMSSSADDKILHFLSSLGKIHNAGVDVSVDKLYPSIEFPVSNDTPSLSNFITWDHSKSWDVPIVKNLCVGRMETRIDLLDESNKYLEGHRLDSRVVYPAMGYLYMAWKALASTMGVNYKSTPVVFENIQFKRAAFLGEEKPTTFIFNMFRETGEFQITEGGEVVVSGVVSTGENMAQKMFSLEPLEIPEESGRLNLNTDDFYKEMTLRGYNFDGAFRSVQSVDQLGRWVKVNWKGNWVTFLDSLAQVCPINWPTRAMTVPTMFQQVTIDPDVFFDYVSKSKDSSVPVSVHPNLKTIQCPGIEIRGVELQVVSRRKQEGTLSVEQYKFSPYFDSEILSSGSSKPPSLKSRMSEIIQIGWENMSKRSRLNINNVFSHPENCLAESIAQVMAIKPWARYDLTLTSSPTVISKIDENVQNLGKVLNVENLENISLPDQTINFLFVDDNVNVGALGNSLVENGYLVVKSKEKPKNVPQDFLQIAQKSFDQGTLSLFRKVSNPVESKVQALTIETTNLSWLPKLQNLLQTESPDKIFLVSQNDPENGIIGLVKCLRLEPGGERIRCIFDPEGKLELNFESPNEPLQKILQQDLVMNVLKNGQLGAYQHISVESDQLVAANKRTQRAFVDILTPGDLTSLRWIQMPVQTLKNNPEETLCQVHYASLNFPDIMAATRKLPLMSNENGLGKEFAGIDLARNKRVMGLPVAKAMATQVYLPEQCLWAVPDHWTLEEAATVPAAYIAAYYALYEKVRLQKGQSILIHSGTGGLGQAAINIALDANCKIFTTVGSPEKREFIKKLFPQILEENIGNSQDCSFEPQILNLTRGKGVDIIFNTLTQDKLQASIRCLAPHGKFLEMGKYDAVTNNKIGLKPLLNNNDFLGVAPDLEMEIFGETMELMGTYLQDGINRGVVKPLSRTVFNKDQVEDAFLHITGGNHMGKVLIKVREETHGELNQPVIVNALARSYFCPNKYYVIIGGLSGLGLEVAHFLAERGAKKLVLLSRSGVKNGYQERCIGKLKGKGVEVETKPLDLSDFDVAKSFIEDLNERGTVGGIFNSGLVLHDGPIGELTEEDFRSVAAPKFQITKNLDQLTREYCKELDHFVVFSTYACGRGNAYQTNYGFTNASMELICERRAQDGLPGLSIQWSAIGEAGFVAEQMLKSNAPKTAGDEVFVPQRISSCLEVLDYALQHSSPVMSCFSSMVVSDRDRTRDERQGLVTVMSNILGIKSLEKVNPTTKLQDIGLDSLAAIELKMILEMDYDLFFTPKDLKKLMLSDVLAIDAGTFNQTSFLQDDVAAKVVTKID